MAYTDPTPADLRARFPVFSALSDPVIQGAINEAGRRVDETWPEEDFTLAKLLYSAHVLTLDGLGTGKEAQMIGFKSVALGPIKLDLNVIDRVQAGTLQSTTFGVRFLEMVEANFAGGTVAVGPPVAYPGDCW